MITLHEVSYTHPNKELLFQQISFSIPHRGKIALIGNNGTGKSTLLRLMAGELLPTSGSVKCTGPAYYVPQLTGQFSELTVAQALRAKNKIFALHEILQGRSTEEHLLTLDDDWLIEERCREALAHWQLDIPDLSQSLGSLSGGQQTKVFLAGIQVVQPEIVLLDEPSNHLDTGSRALLYHYIKTTKDTLVVVSHDRELLRIPQTVMELNTKGITLYGGNYDFYLSQKAAAHATLKQDVQNRESALRKARETERAAIERQQKLEARGKNKQEKAGVARIMMNTLKNNAERTSAKLKGVHADKADAITKELSQLRSELPANDQMKLDLDNSGLHKGKTLVHAQGINYIYDTGPIWKNDLDFHINSGERIAISGRNGSGKSTLLKIILGRLQPVCGTLQSFIRQSVYIDQQYSLINPQLSVYEQAQSFNAGSLQEHDVKIRLNRYLFGQHSWDKPCKSLSGGERMRLALCCITIGQRAPDMILLDEPTNNLDIRNVEILSAGISSYQGTLIVISHDEHFLKSIGIERTISSLAQ